MGDFIGLTAVCLIFGIPLLAVWTEHKRKLMEMQLRLGKGIDENLRAELEAMKNEIRSLRDTTTQFDISFDTALQRVDARVSNMETRAIAAKSDEQNPYSIGNR